MDKKTASPTGGEPYAAMSAITKTDSNEKTT
jgi:hypothetical protein